MEQCFPAFGREEYRTHELQPPARAMSKKSSKPKQEHAAAYARRSSKHPKSSIARQMTVIRKYAKRRGLEIVMAYSDGRKGGGKP
jgi:predicted site-specific integrase-resolvase